MDDPHHALGPAVAAARSATAEAAREAADAAGWDVAVAAWEAAVDSLSPTVTDELQAALIYDSAARTRLQRAWAGGPPSDLDAAADLERAAVERVPASAEERGALLNNLGVALRNIWDRDHDRGVLDEAIATGGAAVAASPAGSAQGVTARLQLSRALRARFAARPERADLQAAITVLTQAASHGGAITDIERAECHEMLGNALYDRFAVTSAPADQEAAVENLRRAAALIGDHDEDAPGYRSNLASALLGRFESHGERADLDDAITLLDEATAIAADRGELSSELLTNAGNARRIRSEADGSVNDVEDALAMLARAVEAEQSGARRAGMQNNLAAALLQRFELTGQIADLDAAVDILDDALAGGDAEDPHRAVRSSNLGIALRARQLRRPHAGDDFDRAVAALEQALAATPEQEPEAPAQHANLGNVLHQRYDVTNDIGDLRRAVDELETALAATPAESPDRAGYLNNLAATLAARAARPGSGVEDLERALSLSREAVRLCPSASAQRVTFLVNLGNAASERFTRLGEHRDLIAARDAYRRAAEGGLLVSPGEALAAARNWTEWASERRAWREVAEAFAHGEAAARALFGRQFLRADKESWLRDAEGLATEGAYALGALKRASEAAVALERGRALLLSELLDPDAADLDRLAADHAPLAERFRAAAVEVRRLEGSLASAAAPPSR